ncbi:LamG-like jellyroll fold domain-containing protein [Saccharicrinis aurantiacus]|uniref:LamG-like jellyroll fold domain-containing protein n=1 Tax=Saccharicrinis aurantiacus TaxID=1849719 RepID=UPI00249101E9|nr:LamG-like jellyroll fold domain-containing protein [Saccharicrinis aurantiacus]
MKNIKLILLVKCVLVLTLGVSAQSGPGGIGNSNGDSDQPENIIWLDASDLTSFGDADTWFDKSGNNNNAVHIGGTPPTWNSSVIGGQPALKFTGVANEYLRILDDQSGANKLDNSDELSIFAVLNSGSNDQRAIISKRLNSSNRSWALFFNNGHELNGYVSNKETGGGVGISGTPSIASYVYDGSVLTLYHNGVSQSQITTSVPIPDRTENVTIGLFEEGDTRYFNGDIAEIIVFRNGLNTAQRIILESYLSQKYGISVTKDIFSGGDISYNKDFAAVGVESDGENNEANSSGLYLSLSNSSNGDYLAAAHNGVSNTSADFVNSAQVTTSGAASAWNRSWYVKRTETTGTPTVRLSFDLSEALGGKFPQDITNYVLLTKSSDGGNYSQVTVANKGVEVADRIYFDVDFANFSNGYFTLGTLDETQSPLEGGDRRIWYTLRSTSEWNNPEAWTLEPCGCLPNNPEGYTPITSPTAISDKVVILSGKKIIVPAGVNDLANAELIINGELDLGATSNHSFATIEGGGLVTMAADNFPEGDASKFITTGEDEGKVEFYGSGYTINDSHEFFDVDVKLDASGSEITLLRDLTINGDFRVERGKFTINDNSSSQAIDIRVNGDAIVLSDAQILLGTGNARHQFSLLGDFENQGGIVHFTNRTAAIYNSDATDGIIDFNLLNDAKNQVITCNGITNFYRIEIDKGIDKTYIASINASDVANFNLYGSANHNHGSIAQLATNDNALGLLRGTVRIGQNVIISELNTSSNYNISTASRLWIDGGAVSKTIGTAIVPYGEIKISSGIANIDVNSGITLRENGYVNVEGGELNVRQIRTSVLGAEHKGGYKQSGGVVNITGANTNSDYYPFNLTFEGNSFQMSGGVLNIDKANSKGGIFINSSTANQNVTGGTVNLNIGDSNTFKISSKAPFYNLNLTKTVANTSEFVLDDAIDVGSTDVYLEAQPLVVLNDFRIRGEETNANYPDITLSVFSTNSVVSDLYIGGSFFIEEGGVYNCLFGGTSPYDGTNKQPTQVNTTYFNQTIATSSIDTLYWGHSGGIDDDIDKDQRFELGNFILDRTSGNELRTVAQSNIKNNQILIDVNGDASVLSGTLDQGRMTFRTWGKIVNNDRMGTYYSSGSYPVSGGTPSTAQIRFREEPPVIIETSDDAVFGNLRFNVNPTTTHVTLTSDMKIERMEFTKGAIYLKNHNLTIDEIWNLNSSGNLFGDIDNSDELSLTDDGVVGNKLIYTDGKASDGGLSLLIDQNTPNESKGNRDKNRSPITFPIGFTNDGGATVYYRPAQIKVKDFVDDGYVTVRTVSGELQTSNPTGSSEILQHYWRVTHDGFSTLPTVAFQFYYQDKDDVTGIDKITGASQEANYVPGYVLGESPYTRYYESEPISDVSDVVNTETSGTTRRIVFNGSSTGGEFTQAGFVGFTLANANFTAGEVARFSGVPKVYYNKRNNQGSWNSTSSWFMDEDQTEVATDYPKAGDIAIIRGNNYNDNITVNGNHECAEIIFVREGVYEDIEDLPRLRLESTDVLNVGRISGVGDIYLRQVNSSSAILNADIGDFARNDTCVVEFYMNQDGTYTVELDDFFAELPTLRIYGNTSTNRYVTFNYDLVCKNLIIDGYARLNIGGNYTVENLTRLGFTNYGRIQFPNGADAYTFRTKDFLTLTGKNGNTEHYSVNVAAGNTNAVEHKFIIERNIDLNYRESDGGNSLEFDLYNSATENKVILEFEGDESAYFTNSFEGVYSSNVELYRLILNKGISNDSSLTLGADFNLRGPTSGVGIAKALEIKNGLLVMDNSELQIDLSTGDDDFSINSTSGLEITQGSAFINGGSNLSLDGLLKLSGGTLDMSGGENAIIYTVSGNSSIEISDGTLLVGSQIRRSVSDELGVLKYTQSGGSVEIGVSSGGDGTRGMLEILNTGSSFHHTGGNLSFIQQNSNTPTAAALHLEPSSYSTNGSVINIFNADTPSNQNAFKINSKIILNDINIGGTNNPEVQLTVRPLNVEGELNINSGATLDAASLDMNLTGDFVNNGTFIHSNNEVNFVGGSAQQISGNTTFYKLTKDVGSDELLLTTNTELTVEYELTLNSGTINDGGNAIYVLRDIINNGSFTSGGGDGVVLNGSVSQRIYGNGSYDRIYLDNSAGFTQEDGNIIEINQLLQMESGILDIGKNLIVFNEGATVNSIAGFGATNMIQTNISFVDAGLKKLLNPGAQSFIFPLGSGGIYTPVNLNITNNTSSSSYIRVKGAKEVHPSVVDLSATAWDEKENVLKYYWIIDANGFNDFTGTITMNYPNSLVSVTATGKTYDDYITARLLSRGTGDWNKDIGTIDTTNDILTFDFTTATDDDGIIGDYTAGLDEAIPNQVPTYTSVKDGDWNDTSVWTPTPPVGGPRGAMVVINDQVAVPIDYISSYRTTISGATDGRILIEGTEGHRLGNVLGTGSIYLETGSLPAGDYTEFFKADGGTLEFGGDMITYPVLSGVSEVNNLKFQGTGERDLPNVDLNILGDLTIESTGVLLVDNKSDRSISLKGDFIFNSGSLDSGQGNNATMIFDGTSRQYIKGASLLTGSNALYNLTIANAAGVDLQTGVEVDRVLTLTNGILNTEAGSLTLTYSEVEALQGGTSSAFVEGPMAKMINHNEYFDFPIGRSGRYGTIKVFSTNTSGSGLWEAQYFNTNPATGGYDPTSVVAPLEFVNKNEYWKVKGPSGSSARLTLTWDTESGVNPDANFRITQWQDLATDAWSQLAVSNTTGDSNGGNISSQLQIDFNEFTEGSVFTFGSILTPAYTWLGNNADWFDAYNWTNSIIPSASSHVTINAVTAPQLDPVIDPAMNSNIVQVNDLTINSGASLTLKPGTRMTVNGNLLTNDGLVIENSNEKPTSFITLGSVSDSTNLIWSYSELRYWYIGHATENPSIDSYDAILGGNDYFLLDYHSGAWANVSKGFYPASRDPLSDPLIGTSVIFENPATISHVGILNNNNSYTINYTANGWYLISNPYPSYLNLSNTSEWEFGTADKTVYTRTDLSPSSRGFTTYNIETGIGANGGSEFITPGQAFWVLNNGNNNFTIKKGARAHTETIELKSASTKEHDIVRLLLVSENSVDESVIAFRGIGTLRSTNIDSKKRMSTDDNALNFYSKKEDVKLTINVMPDFSDEFIIPLGYSSKTDVLSTIKFTNSDLFDTEAQVYLRDNVLDTETDLRTSQYQFMALAGGEEDRFELAFVSRVTEPQIPTDIDDSDDSKVKVFAYFANERITVVENLLEQSKSDKVFISVTDIRGAKVYEVDSHNSGTHLLEENFKPGVYIISVYTDLSNRKTCKVVVN